MPTRVVIPKGASGPSEGLFEPVYSSCVFVDYIALVSLAPDGSEPYVIHWFRAEPGFLELDTNSSFNRHPGHNWMPVNWFDLLKNVVEAEPVVVRGSLEFGLKPFAKALKSHGLIDTAWGDGPGDGLAAMVGAWWCDAEAARAGNRIADYELMDSIITYNEVDCKVMMEIMRYFRLNH